MGKVAMYEDMIYKEAEFRPITRSNKEYLDAGGRTPTQIAKETLPGIAIGTGAGMIAGNVIGKKLGGRAGQEIGTLTGLAFGGLPAHIKSSLKDKEVMRNMLKKRHPEMSDDELKKATNKAMWGFWPDAEK